MDLHARYPAMEDLRARARRRIPKFVWEYLDSGTGAEATRDRNRLAMARVGMMPSVLHGDITPDLGTTFLGQTMPQPFGIAPVGMSGLIWPDAESLLAQGAARAHMPYTLSTVAAAAPEDLTPHLGPNAWFQMYPPHDPDVRTDMLVRVRKAGFATLVMTVDVPANSRRERQIRSGLSHPPRMTPRLMAQIAQRPAWARAMIRKGAPHMRGLDRYASANTQGMAPNAFVAHLLRTSPGWDYVKWLRDAWEGPFIVKGILRGTDAKKLEQIGVDAVWVSNHGGRQFDAAPAAIEALPAVRRATSLPIVFDSGVEGGLDILRALALGADFVMMARAWHYAVAALGAEGIDHLVDILRKDMLANMGQLGAADLQSLPKTFALE